MARKFGILVTAAGLAASLMLAAPAFASFEPLSRVEIGETAPDFTAMGADGKAHHLSDYVPRLEAKLGVSSGFFNSLDDDDENDWSFVIKLHALVEAAVSHLLTEHFNRTELSGLFARLDISNETTGKMAFVKTLALLDKPERRFMTALSELRNKLVHDVRNVNFDFVQHIEDMNKDQQAAFLNNFNLLSAGITDDVRNLFRHDPRQALWYSGMAFLGIVYLKATPPAFL